MKQIASAMPTNDAFFEDRSFPDNSTKSAFNLRLRVLKANYSDFSPDNINLVTSRRQVSLSAFAEWAVSVVKWDNLPPELVALAKKAHTNAAPIPDAPAITQQDDTNFVAQGAQQWVPKARAIGEQIAKDTKNSRLNVEQIAGKVHEEMQRQNITGRGNRVPKRDTIKRHALKGIR
jgi:hypothetical protein